MLHIVLPIYIDNNRISILQIVKKYKLNYCFTSELSKKLRTFGCFNVFRCFTAHLANVESFPGMLSLIKNSKMDTS